MPPSHLGNGVLEPLKHAKHWPEDVSRSHDRGRRFRPGRVVTSTRPRIGWCVRERTKLRHVRFARSGVLTGLVVIRIPRFIGGRPTGLAACFCIS